MDRVHVDINFVNFYMNHCRFSKEIEEKTPGGCKYNHINISNLKYIKYSEIKDSSRPFTRV